MPRRRLHPAGGLGPVGGQVEPGGPGEALAGLRHRLEPRHPVGAYGVLRQRHQVPDAPLQHEPQRAHLPVHLAAPAPVVGPQHPLLPHRPRDRLQMRYGVGVPEPRRGVQVEALAHPPRLPGQSTRQGRLDLQLGTGQHRAEPQIPGRPRQPRQDQRTGLRVRQPGQPGPVALHQAVAALGPAVGPHRHPGGAERVDVPVDGADRHLQLRRQLGGGHPAAVLQQEEQGEKPVGAHGAIVRRT